MAKVRTVLPVLIAIFATWGITTVTAQASIPNGVFVRSSEGLVWLVLDGQRVKIPVWSATDEEIAALPVPDRWAVLNDAGAIVAGDRPAWLTAQDTLAAAAPAAPAVAAVDPPAPAATAIPTLAPQPTATTAPATTAAVVEADVTVEGNGIQKSRPFRLAGGNYTIRWTATPTSKTGCYHGGSLQAVDQSFVHETLGNETLNDEKPRSGETQAYRLKPGDYYLSMSSGCKWKVVVSPLR